MLLATSPLGRAEAQSKDLCSARILVAIEVLRLRPPAAKEAGGKSGRTLRSG